MTPDDPFLAAIGADWLDRTARLAYADWLEDRADPRAELVRVCEGMRDEPVWSDRYWELKARRNELWAHVPLEWLEATGYDGSYYDPLFRDGVPDGPRERWRLIREFTERWHGVAVPDVGGQQDVIRAHERRLNVTLPPSVREFAAFVHDLDNYGWSRGPHAVSLFHCASGDLEHLTAHPALSLIYYTLSGWRLGAFHNDLEHPDPPAFEFSGRWSNEVDYDEDGQPTPRVEEPRLQAATVSLAVFSNLFTDLPTAGQLNAVVVESNELRDRLSADFPIRARFDDADVFEADEMLVVVGAPRPRYDGQPAVAVTALVRRPLSVGPVREYLQGLGDRHTTMSGVLGPANFRRQQEQEARQPGYRPPPRWAGVRHHEAERAQEAEPQRGRTDDSVPNGDRPDTDARTWPAYEDGDEIPF